MSEPLTDEELREMRETATVAIGHAPGEWRTGQSGVNGLWQGFYGVTCDCEDERRVLLQPNQNFPVEPISRFVVAAQPFRVLHLLDERDALAAENERLKADLERERNEVLALMGLLADVAPSDREAAERSIRVEQDAPWHLISFETTPGDFLVTHRMPAKEDAEWMAGAMRHNLASVLAQHTAQLRAELVACRSAAQSPRLKAAMDAWRLTHAERRAHVADLLRDTSMRTFLDAADLLDACAEEEQALSSDGETSPETPEAQAQQEDEDEDVRTFEFLWREYALWPDEKLARGALSLKRRLLEIVQPGAALLAAYPHVYSFHVGQQWGTPQICVSHERGDVWRYGIWHEGTLDEMLDKAERRAVEAEAEARAAKAAEAATMS